MRLIFAGTPEVASRALELIADKHEVTLVLTRPDAPIGRKRITTPSPVASKAEQLGLNVHKTNKIDEEALNAIRQSNADKAVIVAYGAMIPQAALSALPWWNLHFSVLPEWRGATPLQHSMMHDTGIGISVFEIDSGLDTGPLISQLPLSFLENETAGEALIRFTEEGSNLLIRSLEENPQPMIQEGSSSLAPKITRLDAKINFEENAADLIRFIRAANPEPMAWAIQNGEPIRIIFASATTSSLDSGKLRGVGEIYKSDDNEIVVQCGDKSSLRLELVQPAGKRETVATDWWNGLKGTAKFD
jgi:methionyl-tRNA formyltransferase|uniref:methionyl-tRNA formyltransferase n=1 Tax=Aquiluna sp. TaxID=2053504 RepID=UPI004047EE99